jgi:acetyltransferase-like isoleucine patch superfamily enzyme
MKGAKTLALWLATVVIAPRYVAWLVMSHLVGPDRALMSASQSLARIPGLRGRYLRVAFLRLVLERCHDSACVEFGTVFSQCGARLGANVYIGPYCQIGRAHIGDDTLLAAGVHVPSGPETHGTARLDVPIRLQPGNLRVVSIGHDCWVGSAAIVMADVGPQTIVAAGAVVTSALPGRVIAGGVPARVLKSRDEGAGA